MRAVGVEGGWAHIGKPLNTSKQDLKTRTKGKQGRPGEDNGRE